MRERETQNSVKSKSQLAVSSEDVPTRARWLGRQGVRVFDVVLYLRNKYLNLEPSESLSTEVGRAGKLCVPVDVPCRP